MLKYSTGDAVEEWPRLDYHFAVPPSERKARADGMTRAEVKSLSRSPYKKPPREQLDQRETEKNRKPTPQKMVCVQQLLQY